MPTGRRRAAATPLPSLPGYEVLRELGRGGMGVVYQARQLGFNRLVALKMLLSGVYGGDDERARFRIEAEAVARLQHPNIVQVHEVGEHDGKPFFSMEFCPGGGLDRKLSGAPLSPAEAARLVETLAGAMQLAHSRNIVHRDLKPANILLTADGAPKITDFGLAKTLDGDGGQTRTGAVMGTPRYMAPEQASGKTHSVGPAADVYALGAILYECLTGLPPFRGDSVLETLEQVRTREPTSLCQLRRGTPRDLETICLKCLRKEPERRYASAEALAEDLRRWREGKPIAARAVGGVERAVKWVRRHAVASALAAAVLLATVLGVAGVVWKYVEARHEADKAKAARDFLVRILKLSDRKDQGGTLTAREILDLADKRIPVEFADHPELRADLEAVVEEVYTAIGSNAPQAMILDARGTVQLQSAREPNRRADPQTLLYDNDRLVLGADADVLLVFLQDFHKERLQPGTEAAIHRKGCEPKEAVRERRDDIQMTFVRLPKGTFYMGGGGGKAGKKTEIKEDFEIAAFDVTQGQWQMVMDDDNPSHFSRNPSHFSRLGERRNDVEQISDNVLKLFPVENVSWDNVQEFIRRLNEKEREHGFTYRLPTEAEWEYACRGGATSEEECSYYFYFEKPTNDLSSEQANFNGVLPIGNAQKGPDLKRTTRVGVYRPNKLGLYDMHGNVWQWCNDQLVVRGGSERPIRGGCWNLGGLFCEAAYPISPLEPSELDETIGFRLVRVPSGGE